MDVHVAQHGMEQGSMVAGELGASKRAGYWACAASAGPLQEAEAEAEASGRGRPKRLLRAANQQSTTSHQLQRAVAAAMAGPAGRAPAGLALRAASELSVATRVAVRKCIVPLRVLQARALWRC